MRTVTNKDIISMLLLRKVLSQKRFELCENSDQDYPISDEIREGNYRLRARTV